MKYYILFLCVLFASCSSERPKDSVDWNSQLLPKELPKVPELPQSPELPVFTEQLQILLKLHNEQRSLGGRSNFELDLSLCEYSQNHSDWMANRNALIHSNMNILLRKWSLLSSKARVAENIAWNYRTEAKVVDAWIRSSGHRRNIMNPLFNKVGFGVSYNSKGEPYWCACFGS